MLWGSGPWSGPYPRVVARRQRILKINRCFKQVSKALSRKSFRSGKVWIFIPILALLISEMPPLMMAERPSPSAVVQADAARPPAGPLQPLWSTDTYDPKSPMDPCQRTACIYWTTFLHQFWFRGILVKGQNSGFPWALSRRPQKLSLF